MNIRSSSIVFALSCITLGGIVYSQSSSVRAAGVTNYPFAALNASYEKLANVQIQGMDRKVTKKFDGATLDEILGWLSSENLNFIANLSAYKSARISLSFDEVKLGEALDSIATMFDAHWERKGQIFTLKPGSNASKVATTSPMVRAPMALRTVPQSGMKVEAPMEWKSGDDFEWIVPQGGIEDKSDMIDRVEVRTRNGRTEAFRYDQKTKKMVPMDLKDLNKLAPKVRFAPNAKAFSFGDHAPQIWSHSGEAFKIDPKTGKQVPLTKEEKAKLEKEWQAWGEKFGKEWEKWGEDYGKQWESWAKEFEKAQKDGKGQAFVMPKMPDGKFPQIAVPNTPGYYFYKSDGSQHQMTPEQKKAFEESMNAMEKSLKGMKVPGRVLDEKAMKELNEHLKGMKLPEGSLRMLDLKALEELKGMKLDGKHFKLDEKAMKELHEKMKLDHKSHMLDEKTMKQLHEKMMLDGKHFMLDEKAMKELQSKMKELKLPEGSVRFALPKDPVAPRAHTMMSSDSIIKVLDSLTADQKAKHKERGHLKWSELTPAQREMLGFKGSNDFTLSFTIGERTLTIKND